MEKGYMLEMKKPKVVEYVSFGALEEAGAIVPMVVPPQTPREPMEFLARSWNVSPELSKALMASAKKRNFMLDRLPEIMAPKILAATIADRHPHHHDHHHDQHRRDHHDHQGLDNHHRQDHHHETRDDHRHSHHHRDHQHNHHLHDHHHDHHRHDHHRHQDHDRHHDHHRHHDHYRHHDYEHDHDHDHHQHHHHKWPFGGLSSIQHHISEWFHHHHHHSHHHDHREKERAEKARVHAAVSVAGVAAAIASIIAGTNSEDQDPNMMSSAMASAAELLASHCIEIAEQVGADHELMASAIESATDVRTVGDLMTLTAAAATALRGATALKQRLQRETKNETALTPSEKSQNNSPEIWCQEGELLKRNGKGNLRWKQVSVYINKKSQVVVKIKNQHLGGALSKKKKGIVYGVLNQMPECSGHIGECIEDETYFGLRTAQGLLEFDCENRISKQKWVDSVQNLLQQVAGHSHEIEHSIHSLKLK